MASFDLKVEDSSPLISYAPSGAWADSPSNDALVTSYSGGSLHTSSAQGASATISFNGTGISFFGGHRSNYGTYTLTVDGETVANGDANSTQQPTIQTLGSLSDLVYGPHTAVLTNTGGGPIDIDFINITTQPSADSSFTSTVGASVSVSFTGNAVAVYGTMAPDHANIQITLDGRSTPQTAGADGFVSLLHTQYYANNLGSTDHVLTMTSIGGGGGPFMDIDAITVYSSGTSTSGSGSTAEGSSAGLTQSSGRTTKPVHASIIGGVLGGVAMLLLLTLVFFFYRRRHSRAPIDKATIRRPNSPRTPDLPMQGPSMMEAGLSRTLVPNSRVIEPPKYPAPTYLPPPPPSAASSTASARRETMHSIAPSYYSDPSYASDISSPQSSTGLLPPLPKSPPSVRLRSNPNTELVMFGTSMPGSPPLLRMSVSCMPNLCSESHLNSLSFAYEDAVWAAFFGLMYRKFFWDFVGGTLRDPGGIQPGPNAAVFVTIIVKAPIIQIISMMLGMFIIALEFPLPLLKKYAIHRSIVFRIVLLLFQTFLAILYYQGTNAAIWSFIAAVCYIRAQFLGETMAEAKENKGKFLTMSPADIIKSVSKKFIDARESGDLLFFPSTIWRHEEFGVNFEIRLCPALQKKPIAESGETSKENIRDAFEPPYNTRLHLGNIEDEDGTKYAVLLNKFAVLPDHFLLVTQEYQSQASPLTPSDLLQAYLLLVEARRAGKQYFAFYNCGAHSGASQARKHIQFIPIEDNNPPIEMLARAANLEIPGVPFLTRSATENIDCFTDKPFSLATLPYANHVSRLPNQLPSSAPEKIEQTLSSVFLSLLDLVISTIRHDPDYSTGRPSYNVLISLEHIHMIPRKHDRYTISDAGVTVNVNALGYAGMLLVKSEEELEALKKESVGKILRFVGLESVHDIQVADTAVEAE
ncbi:hypothetical protein H0H93_005819 [Arthromyces matolae]|nr:hypothetical protein H0H93_005819 [Arthromyces matolae]